MKKITIAIDGHSSCGKSTMAKALARRVGYVYVDTGAMYRSVTLYALQHGLFGDDGTIKTAELEKAMDGIHIDQKLVDGKTTTFLNGKNVERDIRSLEVSNHVSPIAALPFVRTALVAQQQRMGQQGGIVMDGRDIGTTVFPKAELKIFVTASAQVRAQRRYDELQQKGMPADYADILKNVEERDYIDSHREVSPLRQADDALLLDNSQMTIAEQDEWLMQRFREATATADDHSSDSIVIIPTYNEKENIEKIVRAVFGLEKCFHILVIDDGSPDGTAAIVKRLMKEEFGDRLFLVERSGKLGLGTAYITGFKWALERDYQYIFEMDADFSHDPNDLPRLYAACADEGYDVAIGSRYVTGVNVVNWPIGRVLMSYFASKYVRLVTGFKVHDTTAGFKCYKRRVLKTIELDKIRFKGYGFQIEMKYTAYKIGFKIKEVSVIFVNRREGTSKMSGGIFGEAFFGVMRLRWDGWTRKYPAIVE